MADVTGPIATLPGASHGVPEGAMCDEHPDRPAVTRIQGPTDSFGSEMYDCCAECAAAFRAELRDPNIGNCEWCNAVDVPRRAQRDYDEGMSGRVYEVCDSCRSRYQRQLEREDREYGAYDD
jgi:hypothetical protein